MASASAGAIELDYRCLGEGPPLLMIMGLSGTYDHWHERFLEPIARERTVIIYDHRGVGRSTRVEAPFTIAELAGDALALLDALEFERADVLGFSMGGMVAQELALAAPERLRALVLASTLCGGDRSVSSRPEVIERLGRAMSSGDREQALRTFWEINTAQPFTEDADAYAAFCAIAARKRVAVPVVMLQMRAIYGHDTGARLAQLRAPTLVIHGEQDMLVPVANARVLAREIPDAALEILPGAGHLFFWEAPERAAQLVLDHLRSAPVAGAAPGQAHTGP
jgi:3-oxoadipate enol-lactonase